MNSNEIKAVMDWPIFLWQALTLAFVLTLLLELEPRLVIGIVYVVSSIILVFITQTSWPSAIKITNLTFILAITLLLSSYALLPIILPIYSQMIQLFFIFLLIFFWFFWRSRIVSITTIGTVTAINTKGITVQTYFDARAGTNSTRVTFLSPKKKLKVGSIILLETKPSFLGQRVTSTIAR